MSNQTTPRASWRQIHDNLARAIADAERNSAAIRDAQRLLAELDLRPDVGGTRNTD